MRPIHLFEAALFVAFAGSATAQSPNPRIPSPSTRVALSGPRFGATVLPSRTRAKLLENEIDVGRVISQFGWQFEKIFLSGDGPLVAVSEWVLLAGGMDQGTFLPSISRVVGARGSNGMEFGVGPNLSAGGSSLVIAAGATKRAGSMNIPVNLSIVPSKYGARISLLTGFTTR